MSANISPFIEVEDGYTLEATINPEPGIHPGIKFKYRPATWTERTKCRGLAGEYEKQGEYVDKLLSDKIKDWNFPVPVSADNVKRLRASLKSRILDIVLEYVASDEAEADLKN